MSVIALVSAGGAPGVTTTGVALTLSWPGPVLLAECDPDGGSVLPGMFGGHLPADRGLLHLALRLAEDPGSGLQALADQLVPLDTSGRCPVLPGVADPFQAQAITDGAWQELVELLATDPRDVIADVGQVRLAGYPFPVLAAAGLIMLVVRPTRRQVAAAHSRVTGIRQMLGAAPPIGLCVIGDEPYSPSEVRSALGVSGPVVQLPRDERTAARLSDGDGGRRTRGASELLAGARSAARVLHRFTAHTDARAGRTGAGGWAR
jgi:hypothetical protein